MKDFKEYEAMFKHLEPVEEVAYNYVWYAYKNGEAQQFDSPAKAKEFSKNVEKVCTNEAEVKAYLAKCREVERKAEEAWLDDLRQEYKTLTEEQFDICYSEAYDQGHSAGYDEVTCQMWNVVEFAQRLLKTVK